MTRASAGRTVLPVARSSAGHPDALHLAGVDPTKALWRRIFAYILDLFVGLLIALVVATAFGDVDSFDARRCPADVPGGRTCIDLTSDSVDDEDEQILLIDTSALLIAGGTWIAWVLVNDVVLQGATGATVGKFITAARVVRPDGTPPGYLKALGRTLVLIVDTISVVLPIGLWVAIFSRGHRRLGDMAAGTYVVKAQYAGRPVGLT
jgi:uncharacterized RDD family membrane protein YckC